MLAATLQSVRTIRVLEKPEPELMDPGDVIVEVELAGLCGSDLHPWSGREKGLDPGTTMGHELTGRVVAAGDEVKRFRPGTAVLSPFILGWVSDGRGLEGAQAPLVRVPLADSTLLERPDDLSPVEALLLGDVVSTGFFAVERARPAAGSALAVIGLGAVGLAAVMDALDLGAGVVAALDTVEERLEIAASLGARPLPVAAPGGAPRPVEETAAEGRRLAGGEGFECVVDAVGSPEATRLAVELLRPGGFLSIVGVHTEGAFAVAPGTAYDKNLTIAIGRCPVRSRLEALCARHRERRFPIERLVTHRVPLTEASDAYELFAARRDGVVKVVFEPR
jgi:2-desacetyl-2-hydroxyethyl bacteriochlorophyllide A dehydrogenase